MASIRSPYGLQSLAVWRKLACARLAPRSLQSQKACMRSPSSACIRKKLAVARRMASIRSPYGLHAQKASIRSPSSVRRMAYG